MNFCKALILIALIASCSSRQPSAYAKAKADKEKVLDFIRQSPDPLYVKVPDSMKRWIPILKDVLINDQKHRVAGYGFTKAGLEKQNVLDSQNLVIVTSYLDSFGWPVGSQVGFYGKRAIGMVIQHAPVAVQEKYYPNLVEAYKKDSFLFETVAMLEDRINMRRRKFQYYGSQIVYVNGKPTFYPIYNVDSADLRRKTLHKTMPTLKEYMLLFKGDFDLSNYKSALPRLIDSFKVSDTPGVHFKLN